LRSLAAAHRTLVIHGNYLDEEEIAFLAAHREKLSVVYCPRTHDYFEHEPYPLAKMLAAGVRVALGTDSRASSPDLDLLAEMRHVAAHHQLPPAEVLRLGTLAGAEALGLDHAAGSLRRGKQAAFCVVELPPGEDKPRNGDELAEVLLHAECGAWGMPRAAT
jgi:cytosine/adenosine deaminase-related metal-dependent hydrolase